MKAVNEQARQIMIALVEGLTSGRSGKIDNSPGVFMPVTVEHLRPMAQGSLYGVTRI